MSKVFTTTGPCNPNENYMVDLTDAVAQIRAMVDAGQYFTINRARQYGKTTMLHALGRALRDDYSVLDLDFQGIGNASFQTEEKFVKAFCRQLKRKRAKAEIPDSILEEIDGFLARKEEPAVLDELFLTLSEWCAISGKPIVMMIDEVDSATNNQVFWDFLAQIRLQFLERKRDGEYKTFQSVILAGVTDVKNLKRKMRAEEDRKFNSPWNIAADFLVDMSLSVEGIANMLSEYENDHHIGMAVSQIAKEIHEWTNGYPFLVSRICQLLDTGIPDKSVSGGKYHDPALVWTLEGVGEAVRRILMERNTLFDSLMGKVYDNASLSDILQRILFGGSRIPYNPDYVPTMDAEMYGFVRNADGFFGVSNRIFEVRLYDYFLTQSDMDCPISYVASKERYQFTEHGRLDMEMLLKRYVTVYDDIYEGKAERFDEEEGRRRFLLFVRPIINGTGNYYVEARTRDKERMYLVIDYLGERHVVELKIWRGKAYHEKGERQLADYLEHCHLDKGYLLTYSFNKAKRMGTERVVAHGKEIFEVFV